MTEPTVKPYGSWKSPISSDLIVKGSIGVGAPSIEGSDVYWLEMRPSEGGRNVVVRWASDGGLKDLNPLPFNARTRVHEYGGGDYAIHEGVLYFSNFVDQRLYRMPLKDTTGAFAEPEPFTPELPLRYADSILDSRRGRLICVREDHRNEATEPVNEIVAVSLTSVGEGIVLLSGNDFYSSPRLSPDGNSLAWLTWNHPNMPWDGTELWVGQISEDGSVVNQSMVAGGRNESVFQPEWSPAGVLHFVSDRTGWWNLYRHRNDAVEAICPMQAEFGLPAWAFGMSTYAFASEERIVCSVIEQGRSRLAQLDTASGRLEAIETPYTEISSVHSNGSSVVFRAGSPGEPASIVKLDLESNELLVLRRSNDLDIDSGYFSIPQAIEYPTEDGKTAHAFLYLPRNRDYIAPEGELPPLLVKIHGGPTAATSTTLALGIQYWTSRGFAVLDVNYGGSTGYGTEYRRRLNGMWGVVDVDDCANGARYLAEKGLVDGNRLAITGGSAGGYTALAALTFRDVFHVGASHYGVSDIEALVLDTHKFESHYEVGLIGPYPERRDLYEARSPIKHIEGLSCPVIFFQGLEDKIVPPNQAELMVDALRRKGLPVAYVPFEGEQHGFRRAENIKRALDGEFYFYSRIFAFEYADEIEPVAIENFPNGSRGTAHRTS
jgi:dipeptidyl aminopeptidase/acylaminoacyl peptidase